MGELHVVDETALWTLQVVDVRYDVVATTHLGRDDYTPEEATWYHELRVGGASRLEALALVDSTR